LEFNFYKYHGTGNDFVMIDDRDNQFPETNRELVAAMCKRRFGIGADGLILLRNHDKYDFKMVYFNADGNESTMCGNGGRCLVAFAHFLKIFDRETTFEAIDGLHDATYDNGLVNLKMQSVNQISNIEDGHFLDTGSPHVVSSVSAVNNFDVFNTGKSIRNKSDFAAGGGTNVNFVEWKNDSLFVRTYERGVEDETYSCGTGVTASAIAQYVGKPAKENCEVPIETLGGKLSVSFNWDGSNASNVWLKGPAVQVFKGVYQS
tara:strand:- start:1461 stop:2243 length:783 start_codon:yes stop_codon:yes gene_type:complete